MKTYIQDNAQAIAAAIVMIVFIYAAVLTILQLTSNAGLILEAIVGTLALGTVVAIALIVAIVMAD